MSGALTPTHVYIHVCWECSWSTTFIATEKMVGKWWWRCLVKAEHEEGCRGREKDCNGEGFIIMREYQSIVDGA